MSEKCELPFNDLLIGSKSGDIVDNGPKPGDSRRKIWAGDRASQVRKGRSGREEGGGRTVVTAMSEAEHGKMGKDCPVRSSLPRLSITGIQR
jgi:hypothetical protein